MVVLHEALDHIAGHRPVDALELEPLEGSGDDPFFDQLVELGLAVYIKTLGGLIQDQ